MQEKNMTNKYIYDTIQKIVNNMELLPTRKPSWKEKNNDRSLRDRPLWQEILKEQEQEKRKLKEWLDTKMRIRTEILRHVRSTLDEQRFTGSHTIQVIPDKNDPHNIILSSPDAQLDITLHFDEWQEMYDSLRKNAIILPSISLTGRVWDENYSILELDPISAAKIGWELLKHIERKKYPERFGYNKIEYRMVASTNFYSLQAIGIKNWKEYKLRFFDDSWLEESDLQTLFEFLSHYFGKKIDPTIYKKDPSLDAPEMKA